MATSKQVKHRRGNTAEISAATPAAGELWINTDDYTIYIGDGVTLGGYKVNRIYNYNSQDGATTGGTPVLDGPNVIAGHENNGVPLDVHSCTISGGGLTNNENVIGGIAANVFDSGTSNVPPGGPALGTDSRYCVIGGGYDNVVNGLANVINAGMHCVIDNSDVGFESNHCTIGGGSLHKILAGPYNGIFAGTTNQIEARQGYSFIGGGSGNNILQDAQYSFIGGGANNISDSFYSTINGGNGNESRNTNSTVGGGSGNKANQDNATVAGGNSNEITGANQGGFIGGGLFNTISSEGGMILGGRENNVAVKYGTASGYQANSEKAGQEAFANGQFATKGDAQTSRVILKAQTTDATETNLADLNGSVSMPSKTNIALGYRIRVVGHRTDIQGDNAVIILEGMASRGASGVWTITKLADQIVNTAGAATWTARIYDSVGSLRIAATGEAAKNINWVAHVEWTDNQG